MTFTEDRARALARLDRFIDAAQRRAGPVLRQPAMAQLTTDLALQDLIRQGGLTGDRLDRFLETYLANAARLAHPAMMGHQVSVPHENGTLGGIVDVAINNPMAIYEMGASAATVEYAVLNWMLDKVGWTPAPYPGEGDPDRAHGAGVLTHGGSLANLTCLVAARAQADPGAWENGVDPALVLIAPTESHYSNARAAGILGLGQKAIWPAPLDRDGRIDPAGLPETLAAIKAAGKRPMALVANACGTAAGLYDPLDAIADFCAVHGIWMHVDGAHGASALLCDDLRPLMAGIEKADSLTWDAHKMMRTPGLCAAVLMRDHHHIDHAFHQQASYLFHDKERHGFDALHRTVECTKAGLGTKFFMVLAAEGEAGLAAYVQSRYDLAQVAAAVIEDHPAYDLAITPQSNIVCFRVKGETDARQLARRNQLVESEQGYLTTTEFKGQRWLRFTFMNPLTTLDDVGDMLDKLLI